MIESTVQRYQLDHITNNPQIQDQLHAVAIAVTSDLSNPLIVSRAADERTLDDTIDNALESSSLLPQIIEEHDYGTRDPTDSIRHNFRRFVKVLLRNSHGSSLVAPNTPVSTTLSGSSAASTKRLSGHRALGVQNPMIRFRARRPELVDIIFRFEQNKHPNDPEFYYAEVSNIMDIVMDGCPRKACDLIVSDISLKKLIRVASQDPALGFKPQKHAFWLTDAWNKVRHIGRQDELESALDEFMQFENGDPYFFWLRFARHNKLERVIQNSDNLPWMHPPLFDTEQHTLINVDPMENPQIQESLLSQPPFVRQRSPTPPLPPQPPHGKSPPQDPIPDVLQHSPKVIDEQSPKHADSDLDKNSESDSDNETDRDQFIEAHQNRYPNQYYDKTPSRRRREELITVSDIDFSHLPVTVEVNGSISHGTKPLHQSLQDDDSDHDDGEDGDVDIQLQNIMSAAENHTPEMIALTEAVFGLDPEETKKKSGPKVYGLKTHIFKYQALGVVVAALRLKKFRLCFQADDMGLGKTIQAITFIVIQLLFNRRHDEIADGVVKHCHGSVRNCPQWTKRWPKCQCEPSTDDDNLGNPTSTILRYRTGINLICASTNGVRTWMDEFKKHCDLKLLGIQIYIAHAPTSVTDNDKQHGIKVLDGPTVKRLCSPLKNDDYDRIPNLDRVVIISTRQSVKKRVFDLVTQHKQEDELVETRRRGKDGMPIYISRKKTVPDPHVLEIGLVVDDEAHELKSIDSEWNTLIRTLPGMPYILSISGTPLLSGLVDLVPAIWAAQSGKRVRQNKNLFKLVPSTSPRYDRTFHVPQGLEANVVELHAHGLEKFYKKGTNSLTGDSLQEYNQIISVTQSIVDNFMLRRTPESLLHKRRCSSKPSHQAYDILCGPPSDNSIRILMEKGSRDLVHDLGQKRALQLQQQDPSKPPKSLFQIDELRIERIMAAFPFLYEALQKDDDLASLYAHTAYDTWAEWQANGKSCSFFQKWGSKLCNHNINPKLVPLRHILEQDTEHKAILFAFHAWPLVLTAIFVEVELNLKVHLILPGMNGSEKKGFEYRFNDPQTKDPLAKNTQNFQVLGGLKATMGTGLSLIGTSTVIQMGPEWKPGEEAQEVMRVNRPDAVQKHEFTRSYRLLMPTHVLEHMIVRKQRERARFEDLCLTLIDGPAAE